MEGMPFWDLMLMITSLSMFLHQTKWISQSESFFFSFLFVQLILKRLSCKGSASFDRSPSWWIDVNFWLNKFYYTKHPRLSLTIWHLKTGLFVYFRTKCDHIYLYSNALYGSLIIPLPLTNSIQLKSALYWYFPFTKY